MNFKLQCEVALPQLAPVGSLDPSEQSDTACFENRNRRKEYLVLQPAGPAEESADTVAKTNACSYLPLPYSGQPLTIQETYTEHLQRILSCSAQACVMCSVILYQLQ